MPIPPRSHSARLSDDELALWRGFLAWSEAITADIARDLATATGLSAAEYEILVRLSEAPGRAIDQRALAEELNWSASRISHQLSRMATRGYVTRSEVGVGRLMRIAITDGGLAKVAEALAVHAEAVRTYFLAPLSPALRHELGIMAQGTSTIFPG